jgi:Ca-activated chloride channel family protein
MKKSRKLLALGAGFGVLSLLFAACSSSPPVSAPLQPQQPSPASTARTQESLALQESSRQSRTAPSQPAPAAPAGPYGASPSEQVQGDMTTTMRAFSAQSAGAPGFDSANQVGGTDNPNDAPYDATFYKHYGVNPFIDTEDDHFSTFAMDVDTASYAVARRYVSDGYLPDPASVRVEEFVNYFDQRYEPPTDDAFAIHLEGAPSPFGNDNNLLMRVGLQGKEIASEDRKNASLIFVIDVSGSMARENRLGLVKRSLALLVDELRPTDDIGIVVYGSEGRVLMEPTSGEDENRDYIMGVIDSLDTGGSTNAAEGLELGYDLAARTVQANHISRVILLSDGVANVGDTGSNSILNRIQRGVDQGVTLSTIGVGMGNFNDVLMEQLANDGNGNYAYVDTLAEAERVFVENLTGTLQVIAKDSKVQVEFDPEVVKSYRLIGYENRDVADEDFRNDEIDAGEVGAGHNVTALYELKLHDEAEGSAATVFIRYEDPDSGEVHETNQSISVDEFHGNFDEASATFRLSAVVAEYAEILRESFWAKEGSLSDVLDAARELQGSFDEDADVHEFIDLVEHAEEIALAQGSR